MVTDILLICFRLTNHEREKMMGMKHVTLEMKLSLISLAWSSQYFLDSYNHTHLFHKHMALKKKKLFILKENNIEA